MRKLLFLIFWTLIITGCSNKNSILEEIASSIVAPTVEIDISQPIVTTNIATGCVIVVKSDGGSPITEIGLCGSTKINPTVIDNKTFSGGSFPLLVYTLKDLTSKTTYYLRPYATNKVGTSYGKQVTITTL